MKRLLVIASVLCAVGLITWFVLHARSSQFPIQQGKAIRIGYAVEAPFAFIDRNGEVTGEAPEVARQIVNLLQIKQVEWIQVDFESLIPGLEADQFDVAAAGLYITPERAERVLFSDPTFRAQPGLLVLTDSLIEVATYLEAVQNRRVRIAVLAGSVEEAYFKEMRVGTERLVIVPDALTGRVAVETGLADALALSVPSLRWMARNNPSTSTRVIVQAASDTTFRSGYGAFAFNKNNRALREAWNKELRRLLDSQAYLQQVEPFGFQATELARGMTVRQVLSL